MIAAVGDEFQVKKVRPLEFGNEQTEVGIDDWGLNDLVFARVRAAAAPGIAVRRIAYTKEAFPYREGPKGVLFRDLKAELVDLMRQITSGTNCQRYVLVSKSISTLSSSGQSIRGIGIVNWGYPFRHRTYLFALSYIRIFDGRDFSIIRQGSAVGGRETLVQRLLLGTLIRGPYTELDDASFPGNAAEAAHNLALREYARALLMTSLDITLPILLKQ